MSSCVRQAARASIRRSPPLGSVRGRGWSRRSENDAEADDVLMIVERDGIATDHVVRAAEMPTACTLTCIDACAFGHAAAALATTTRLGAVASAAAPRSR